MAGAEAVVAGVSCGAAGLSRNIPLQTLEKLFVAVSLLPSKGRLLPRAARRVLSFLGLRKLPCLLLQPKGLTREPRVGLRHGDSTAILTAPESVCP